MPDANDARLSEQLRRLLKAVEASGRALLPGSNLELLQSIVDAAAQIFGAAAASVSLVDEQEQMLEFKVAYGAGRDDVVGLRLPVDRGIAGYVAMTGQAIAVSNVHTDPRFQHDFAQSTGYVPRSILATPLLLGDRVIGVMEVLDKLNAPTFGMQDMELLAVFARQAALAIHQSQQVAQLGATLIEGLKQRLSDDDGAVDVFAALEAPPEDTAAGDDLLQLAQLFYQIGGGGPAERQACLQILSAFAEYIQSRPSLG